MQTPASFLGSCRKKLEPFNKYEPYNSTYEQIWKNLIKNEIDSFFYIGGNDSMDTVLNLSKFLNFVAPNQFNVIGIPKTIDNDLQVTDHCPGFASAAKFVATTFLELERDCKVYKKPAVTIVEVMGRDAGWLTAASGLSRLNGGTGPNLIYCCERKFSLNEFLNDVETELSCNSNEGILISVSEGVTIDNETIDRTNQMNYFDEFGHKQKSGVAQYLQKIVANQIKCKTRSLELSLLQRSASHLASQVDLNEAFNIGRFAVEKGYVEKLTGKMTTIERIQNQPYLIKFGTVDVELVANKVKKIPSDMLPEKPDINNELISYLEPLIQGQPNIVYENGLPVHLNLNSLI